MNPLRVKPYGNCTFCADAFSHVSRDTRHRKMATARDFLLRREPNHRAKWIKSSSELPKVVPATR